jgi:hypothetical protein
MQYVSCGDLIYMYTIVAVREYMELPTYNRTLQFSRKNVKTYYYLHTDSELKWHEDNIAQVNISHSTR